MGSDTEANIDAQFQLLIEQGLNLQGAFDSEQAIKPEHISLIREWVNQALDLIKPAMPPDDPEFNTLGQIGQAYSNTTSILPGNTSEHIRKVRVVLTTARDYFRAWYRRDFSRVDPGVRAQACLQALDETWGFSRDSLLGLLKGREDGRTKRTALLHSYGRMYCWVHSMVKLGYANDAQVLIAEHAPALGGCLRAILELLLDINLLKGDRIEQGPEKFFSFEKVARHKIAKSSVDLDKEYKHLTNEQRSIYEKAAARTKELNDCVVRLWGVIKNGKNKGKPNRPEHWTGMTVIERVKNLGSDYVRYYQHSYHYCNWTLHSGYGGFLMETKETASLFCALAYAFANEMFLRATRLMIEECAEFSGIDALKRQLDKVVLRGAHVLWDATVKAARTKKDQPA